MPLRPRAVPRHRRSRPRDLLQLLAVQQKGFLHLIVAPDQFQLLGGSDDLTTYQFNTRTAKHTFCRVCGVHPFYVPRSDPDMIDVNVRCLDGIDPAALAVREFDGRNWEEAMERHVPWR